MSLYNPPLLEVKLGDGHALKPTARGTVILKVKFGCGTCKCKLYDVLNVPACVG